jgi:NAD(P)-dependent dehydrogenase (short-subunit alcohol dehydrogenase family)
MSSSQTYLFCGASSKIAERLAAQLIQEGNKVIGISTKEQNFENYSEFHKVDAYQAGQLPQISDSINGIVYFPGTINLKPFARISENDFLNDYHINTLGAVNSIQKYLPNLKDSEGASIVLLSTVAVSIGMPFHSSIAMAKGAIEGLTRSLAAELAPSIRVNAVAPSLTNTPLGERFINTPEKLEASEKRNPLKKIGQAQDIANSIQFLLSDKSSWVTGQILHVDGGMNSLKLL